VIRVEHRDLPPGLPALAVRDTATVTIMVSSALPPHLQRQAVRAVIRAARRAGWLRRTIPAAAFVPALAALCAAVRRCAARVSLAHGLAAAGTAAAATVLTAAVLAGPARVTPAPANGTPPAPVTAQSAHRRRAPRRMPPRIPPARAAVVSPPRHDPASPAPAASPDPSPSPGVPVSVSVSASPVPSVSPPACVTVLGLRVCAAA